MKMKKKHFSILTTGREQDFALQPDHGFVRRADRTWEAPSEAQEKTAAQQEEKEEEE